MSRRSRPRHRDREPAPRDPGGSPGGPIARDIAILALVFGVAVGISELAGAANLGVSFGIGQVCFALALIVLLTRE